jgi:hypothetical protein
VWHHKQSESIRSILKHESTHNQTINQTLSSWLGYKIEFKGERLQLETSLPEQMRCNASLQIMLSRMEFRPQEPRVIFIFEFYLGAKRNTI